MSLGHGGGLSKSGRVFQPRATPGFSVSLRRVGTLSGPLTSPNQERQADVPEGDRHGWRGHWPEQTSWAPTPPAGLAESVGRDPRSPPTWLLSGEHKGFLSLCRRAY